MNEAPSAVPPPTVRRVAVVAVHGVAYHAPGESANAMADLLHSLPPPSAPGAPAYSAFVGQSIYVPLRRAQVPLAPPPAPRSGMFGFLQERSARFANYLRQQALGVRPAGVVDVGNEFTNALLRRYPGGADGDTFDTIRIRGKRLSDSTGVDIYEAYWADLTRPENTILSFGFILFQLLIHLGSLSRLALDSGSRENPDKLWASLRRAQDYAVRFLQIPIPLLNFILLIAALSILPLQLSMSANKAIAFAFPAIIGIVVGLLAWKTAPNAPQKPIWWALRPFLFAAGAGLAAAGLFCLICSRVHQPWDYIVAVEWWIAWIPIYKSYVLDPYDEVREGTHESGWALYALAGLVFLAALFTANAPDPAVHLTHAVLGTMLIILALLRVSWFALILCAIAAWIFGEWAWRRHGNLDQKARARAAVRTSRLALAVPSLLTLLLVLFLWAGLFGWVSKTKLLPCQPVFGVADSVGCQTNLKNIASSKIAVTNITVPGISDFSVPRIPKFLKSPTLRNSMKPLFLFREDANDLLGVTESPKTVVTGADVQLDSPTAKILVGGTEVPHDAAVTPKILIHGADVQFDRIPVHDYFRAYLLWCTGSALVVMLALASIGFLLLILWVLPSVLTEKIRSRTEYVPPRWSTNEESIRLGKWMSRGLDTLPIVSGIFWIAIFLVPFIFSFPAAGAVQTLFRKPLYSVSSGWILSIGTLLLGGLAYAARHTNSILRPILDVDNYLRTSPCEATPRAKIAERYVSLLRYIDAYRDEQGHGYNSVVIVAHSLGALISADLLRILRQESDPELGRLGYDTPRSSKPHPISITLFSMGNPLRQLLNRFFPYLYDWMRPKPDGSLKPVPPPGPNPPAMIASTQLPDPAQLGLKKWVSAYRSGDYVGRSVWLDEWYERSPIPPAQGVLYPPPSILSVTDAPGGVPTREEICIGAGAHTRYWDDTAWDIAEKLNDLI